MSKTQVVGIRMKPELIEALDLAAKQLSRPGLELGRTDTARIFIAEGLQSMGLYGDVKKKKATKGRTS